MNPTQPLAVSSRLVLISALVLLSKSLKWEQRVGHGGAAGADGESKLDVTLVLYHLRNKTSHQSSRASGQFERADVLPRQHCDQRSHLVSASGYPGERCYSNSYQMTDTLSKLPATKLASTCLMNIKWEASPHRRADFQVCAGLSCIAPLFFIKHTDAPDWKHKGSSIHFISTEPLRLHAAVGADQGACCTNTSASILVHGCARP